jgi:hypothetical protein
MQASCFHLLLRHVRAPRRDDVDTGVEAVTIAISRDRTFQSKSFHVLLARPTHAVDEHTTVEVDPA